MIRYWTPASDEQLIKVYPFNTNKELSKHLGRTISSIRNRATKLSLVKEIDNGGCFKKSQTPWNKGLNFIAGGNSSSTQFKAGREPHNTTHDGAISIRGKEGERYKHIRIANRTWVLLHRYEWEKKKGKISEGMILRCKGNVMDTDPGNWELITRAQNIRLNENRKAQSEGLKKAWRMKNLRKIYELD